MTAAQCFEQVSAFLDREGHWPTMAIVHPKTAEKLTLWPFAVIPEHGHFGHRVLGVTDWFTDPDVSESEIRLS